MKIRTQILLFTLSTVTLVFVLVLSYVNFNLRNVLLDDAKLTIDANTRENAQKVNLYLNNYMNITRTMAQLFACYDSIPAELRRPIFTDFLHKALTTNHSILSVWTIWEPNSIDNLDSIYAGKIGSTALGNFSTTFYRDNGIIKMQDESTLSVAYQDDYYVIPKTTLKETLLDPYFYSYTGNNADAILQTNTVVPIMNNNRFVGVVGIDVSLDNFRDLISDYKPFKDSYSIIVSNNGAYVAHPDATLIGKKSDDGNGKASSKSRIKGLEYLKQGKAFSFTVTLPGSTGELYISYAPILVGQCTTPWALGTVVPVDNVMAKANDNFWRYSFAAFVGILLIAIIISIVSYNIAAPLTRIAKLLKMLNRGNENDLKLLSQSYKGELGEIAHSAYTLIHWINSTGEFAKAIGKGDLNAEYQLHSENDILGQSLLELRNALNENEKARLVRRAENANRTWIAEGLAKFSVILRTQSDNLPALCYTIISNLVKYTNTNQGGLFLVNDDEPNNAFVELVACFAYNRQKMLTKHFDLDEGLIGRCLFEKRTIHQTNLPDNYLTITSGLGEATPTFVAIVPLKFNELVFGAMELATFNKLKDHEIEFIERVADNIASTISTTKTNIRTAILLDDSRRQSEELVLKEEEMRRNNEELRITQEEMMFQQNELKELLNQMQVTQNELRRQKAEVERLKEEEMNKIKDITESQRRILAKEFMRMKQRQQEYEKEIAEKDKIIEKLKSQQADFD